MATENKITKVEMYDLLLSVVAESGHENSDEMIEFINAQVAQINAKAEKAKARAAEKRAAGDELRDAVYNVLTDEYVTADDIVDALDMEDVTRAKVVARLKTLVDDEYVEKTQGKTEEKKRVTLYRRAAAETV